jgi:hydrogenase nickel incorporation protein HypB
MCMVCGCGHPDATVGDEAPHNARHGAHHGVHHGDHHDTHPDVGGPHGDLHFGLGAARVSVPGLSAARTLRLEADVRGANDRLATANRAHFAAHGVAAYNLVSSPGSGKTTLLCATIAALRARPGAPPLAVIEGDQQTTRDADRIRATGAPAIQVNTGHGCHLDAGMVARAFARLPLHGHPHAEPPAANTDDTDDTDDGHRRGPAHDGDRGPAPAQASAAGGLLLIENVGNLVCPALWDLGERAKVVVLSVTEGEDKPLKYPDMFAAARLMVLHKVDLLPHLDFDLPACIEHARRVNPDIEVLLVSARSGQGMDAWIDWLLEDARQVRQAGPDGPALGREHGHLHGHLEGHSHPNSHSHEHSHPDEHGHRPGAPPDAGADDRVRAGPSA